MVCGAVLIGIDSCKINLNFVLRTVSVVVFGLGAINIWLELLVSGAILITVSVVTFVFNQVDNEVLEGLVVVAVRLAVLVVTAFIYHSQRKQKMKRVEK